MRKEVASPARIRTALSLYLLGMVTATTNPRPLNWYDTERDTKYDAVCLCGAIGVVSVVGFVVYRMMTSSKSTTSTSTDKQSVGGSRGGSGGSGGGGPPPGGPPVHPVPLPRVPRYEDLPQASKDAITKCGPSIVDGLLNGVLLAGVDKSELQALWKSDADAFWKQIDNNLGPGYRITGKQTVVEFNADGSAVALCGRWNHGFYSSTTQHQARIKLSVVADVVPLDQNVRLENFMGSGVSVPRVFEYLEMYLRSLFSTEKAIRSAAEAQEAIKSKTAAKAERHTGDTAPDKRWGGGFEESNAWRPLPKCASDNINAEKNHKDQTCRVKDDFISSCKSSDIWRRRTTRQSNLAHYMDALHNLPDDALEYLIKLFEHQESSGRIDEGLLSKVGDQEYDEHTTKTLVESVNNVRRALGVNVELVLLLLARAWKTCDSDSDKFSVAEDFNQKVNALCNRINRLYYLSVDCEGRVEHARNVFRGRGGPELRKWVNGLTYERQPQPRS